MLLLQQPVLCTESRGKGTGRHYCNTLVVVVAEPNTLVVRVWLQNKPYVTLTLFLAVSAGFSTAENVLYTYTACSGSAASLGMTLLSAVVRGKQ